MKLVKKTAEYSIFERKDKRHAVRGSNAKWINGEAKVEILQKEGLLKKPEPKPAEPAPVEDSQEEAASEE
ncbi:hypothetical protein [Teredinibacter sp. KSP-S5-2]|uniref:hypothetical protein n=1 Tax=Teredinibacter sp. KSP-S5-2 TaxID=3034506 RepID=UPI0029350932|nr:hypothetical protein [Teredinibacter sp. KSP-S5-2]WNO09057.1 hypothetical protein P5V12_19110 [Teredinibacter sp. KSP-S5-2]